ncbi:TonB-dependent receptor [Barnesiella sp. ET7]|nr:TonB-dependent receptor [Barnesiella sp. ET7]MCR8912424.1 TonB-dependent receptor [Barnesiella sp. ET7]
MSKINIDLKAGMKMNKYLSMDSKISLSRTKATDRPQYGKGGEVYQLLYIPRNIPLNDLKTFRSDTQRHIYYVNPTLQELNPYYINYQYSNMDERWRAFGYYTVKIGFTPWLYATGKYSFDYYDTSIEEQNRTNGIDDQSKESYKSMEQRYYEHNIEGMILGHNTFAERFRLGYSLGGNIMYQRTSGLTGYSENMAKEGIWYHNSALGKNTAEQTFTERETRSVFGTLQFAWDEWIALDLTARNDWSSTLPKNNCSYFYPSANLSWVFSDMMRRYDMGLPSWITFGKLRLSAAQVGKDTDPYVLYNYLTYTQGVNGPEISYPKIKANPDLKPEISSAYEAGLDMKFFNNRLGFDFTYYRSLTKNQIMTVPMAGEGIIVPPSAPVIDACHMNGVKILGNVFFPPQAYSGDPEWVEQMLTKEGNTYPYAEKMYEIAKYYGFDGWFINEETYASTASDWVEWIKYFYQCAEADGNHDMYIQWYDASMYVNNALDIMMANPNTSFFANYGSAGKVTIEQHRSRGYRRVVQPARSPRRQGCSLYHRPRIMDDYPDCRTRSLWQGWNGYRRDYGKPRTGSSQPRQPGPKDGRSCRPGRKHRNLFDAGCFGESRTGRRDHHLRLDRRPDAGHLLHGCQGCRLHRDRESDREVIPKHTAQPLGVARPIT